MTADERLIETIARMSPDQRARIRRLLDDEDGMAGAPVPRNPRHPFQPPIREPWPGVRRRNPLPIRRPFIEPPRVDDRWIEPMAADPFRFNPHLPDGVMVALPSYGPPVVMC